ncbi:hypothetical protein N7G274_004157 [Stereocaulon virgatum]|uniref:ferric-chelate reductase (NADPH) n=1 Tax=Stereocaulon virgatum TaxID=373712 RepID=A0ABR4AEU0_9LECA
MGWPYHFVSLDDGQQVRRRQLLDSYGQIAQFSILLLPLIYQLSLGVRLLFGRLQRKHVYEPVKEHQSPVASGFKQPAIDGTGSAWAKLRWALDEPVAQGWETRKEWLAILVWGAWLLLLVLRDTGDDYLHLTRRFGIVAASQLPLHYALALKSWSPIQYLARLSHESLNPYHRLLGRLIILLMTCHATLYLNFYFQNDLLQKRLKDSDVILGLTSIISALLIGTTALARIRHWNYRLFFYSHVMLSLSLLPILYFHVPYLRLYIIEATAIYILLIAQRNTEQSSTTATIEPFPGTNLLSITIPLTPSLKKRNYTPGQHIYLSLPSLPQKLRINPFSIANPDPTSDNHIHLVVRTLNGTTALLASLTKPPQPTPILVEGPYGSANYFPDPATYDRILFVAGGVGATFNLPIYRDLLRRSTAGDQVPPANFVWAVRKDEDAVWGVQVLSEQCKGILPKSFEIFVTGKGGSASDGPPPIRNDSIELQEREGLLDTSASKEGIAEAVRRGRPNFRGIVDEVFEQGGSGDRVAVLVCGPSDMGASVRKEVGRWVWRGREVWWHSEEFGW